MFGNFSKSKSLSTLSKIAAILAIVLFIAANGIRIRFGGWYRGDHARYENCHPIQKDSTLSRY
jgi:hypothetical protein